MATTALHYSTQSQAPYGGRLPRQLAIQFTEHTQNDKSLHIRVLTVYEIFAFKRAISKAQLQTERKQQEVLNQLEGHSSAASK